MRRAGGPRVGIVLGSENDLPLIAKGVDLLKKFGVEFEVELSSAHRAPEKTARYAREAEGRGLKVLIGAAGYANHLAGDPGRELDPARDRRPPEHLSPRRARLPPLHGADALGGPGGHRDHRRGGRR